MRNTTLLLIVLGLLSSLISCAHTNPFPTDVPGAIQRATTPCDHEALANHYEDTAKEYQLKIKEHKKILESYGSVTFNYGKEGLAMQSHSKNLINLYEQVIKANMEMANSHRAMAAEIK